MPAQSATAVDADGNDHVNLRFGRSPGVVRLPRGRPAPVRDVRRVGRTRLRLWINTGFCRHYELRLRRRRPAHLRVPILRERWWTALVPPLAQSRPRVAIEALADCWRKRRPTMKDFFDLWHLAHTFEFDGREPLRTIRATLQSPYTDLPRRSHRWR